jgi:3-mercaptopyruvate sulfurtransferase SseA/rhodanese-related sulfurtransferase
MRQGLLVTVLILFAIASAKAVEPYPWIPGNRKVSEPVYPEILITLDKAVEAVAGGDLLLLDNQSPNVLGDFSGHEVLLLSGSDPYAAGRMFLSMEAAGFPVPRILKGGAKALDALQREVSVSPKKASRKPSRNEEIFIERKAVREAFGRDHFEIIDLRGADTWSLATLPEPSRAGHIPHSLPFDFSTLLADGDWPDPAEARKQFLKLGPREREYVDSQATFIIYGEDQADPNLGLAYLLLRLMDIDVRVYDAGWQDWSTDLKSPIVRIMPTRELENLMRAENPQLVDEFDYESFIFLDLRGSFDFRRRHLPGSIHLPMHVFADSLSGCLDANWPEVDPSTIPVVLYCYGPECVRSRNGASVAAHQGFRNLIWYRDGVTGWKSEGLPLFRAEGE